MHDIEHYSQTIRRDGLKKSVNGYHNHFAGPYLQYYNLLGYNIISILCLLCTAHT